jgi:hypothetical protein
MKTVEKQNARLLHRWCGLNKPLEPSEHRCDRDAAATENGCKDLATDETGVRLTVEMTKTISYQKAQL